MNRIAICGNFAFGKNKANGQTIKTKIVAQALEAYQDKFSLDYIQTAGWLGLLLLIPRLLFYAIRCRHILILPARRGLFVIIPILSCLRLFFSFKVHHLVIGGWLPSYLDNHRIIERLYQSLNPYIYSETTTQLHEIRNRGYKNAYLFPNFKILEVISDLESFEKDKSAPLTLCTFSRVMRMKGIGDATRSIIEANKILQMNVYTLDIYGQIEVGEEIWFDELMKSAPSYIQYKGVVPYEKSTSVLKGKFALLFPTHYYKEGLPGTIIDAYASGVPVISAKWENYNDAVIEGVTGYGYPIDTPSNLTDLLVEFAKHPEKINSLRPNCIDLAKRFAPESVMPILLDNLD